MSKTARVALNRILDLDSNLVAFSRHCSCSHRRRSSSVYCSYADLIQGYVLYIKKPFSNRFVIVVFDEYDSQKLSIKVFEQSRRASKVTSADIAVSPLNNTPTTQEEVAENGHNKTSLMTLVSEELNAVGIITHEAEADTDTLIISTTLEYSHVDPSVNVCKDVDVMIYLDKIPPGDQITLLCPQPVD